jgi:hypothetical protein
MVQQLQVFDGAVPPQQKIKERTAKQLFKHWDISIKQFKSFPFQFNFASFNNIPSSQKSCLLKILQLYIKFS